MFLIKKDIYYCSVAVTYLMFTISILRDIMVIVEP